MLRKGMSALLLLTASVGAAKPAFVGENVRGSLQSEVESLVALKSQVVRIQNFVETNKGLTLYSTDDKGDPVGFVVVGADMAQGALHVLGQRSTPAVLTNVSTDAVRMAVRSLQGN